MKPSKSLLSGKIEYKGKHKCKIFRKHSHLPQLRAALIKIKKNFSIDRSTIFSAPPVFHLDFLCLSLLVLAFSCPFWAILSQKPNQFYLKNQNRQMPFVARYGFFLLVLVFCGCFHLSIALLVVAFCWYEKPKRATKGKKSPNGNQALSSSKVIFTT